MAGAGAGGVDAASEFRVGAVLDLKAPNRDRGRYLRLLLFVGVVGERRRLEAFGRRRLDAQGGGSRAGGFDLDLEDLADIVFAFDHDRTVGVDR